MKSLLITLFSATAASVLAISGQAATIVVDTELDVVAEDGLCSLREAIINSNWASQHGSSDCVAGEAGGNTIVFDAALTGETITLGGEHLQITTRNLTIEGPVPGDPTGLILDGDQASRVFNILGPGMHVAVTLRGMTLTGGRTEASPQPGGGLHAQSVVVTLDNVAVVENSTGGNSSGGGGISGLLAKIELIDSLVENNHVEGLSTTGGGIFVRECELELTRTRVIGNRTEGGGNSNGGGIWAGWFGANGSDLSLTDSVVAGNSTEAGTAFGGGIWAAGGEVVITGSTISGNSIANGGAGGISVDETQFVLLNSTVSGNTGTSPGGGLQIRRSDASLIHSTVAFNMASGNGTRGIWLFGTEANPASLNLANSLVVQESASEATCSSNEFSTITSTGSLSTHDSCTGLATAPGDIKLLVLADNGGPAQTHAPGPLSVVIDGAGDCASEYGITVDQRGEPRPGGDSTACDIGAFEQQEPPPVADLQVDLSVSPEEAEAGGTVTFVLEILNLGPDAAENASALFTLPNGYEFVSATPDLGSYDSETGEWTMGAIAPSVVMNMQLEATMNAEGGRVAVATAGSDTFDPDTSNNTDQAAVTLLFPTGPMIVDTLLDVVAEDGLCSLREAIINANSGDQSGSTDCVVGDLILFDGALIGGTIELDGTQLPAITVDLTIEGPVAGDPAGIVLDGQGLSRILEVGGAAAHIRDLTLTGGHTSADNRPGGALYVSGGADVELSRVRMIGNSTGGAVSRGGAAGISGGSLTLLDSDVSGNQTMGGNAAGGAIWVENGTLLLDGTTVADNQSSHVGGGLYIEQSTLVAINSTLSGNTTTQGGGGAMYVNRGIASLTHVTVAFNSAASGASGVFLFGDEFDSAEMSLNNSLFVDDNCGLSGDHSSITSAASLSTQSSCTGTATPSGDIKLLGLSNYGGLARTHALGAGSVAIGFAGDCPEDFDIDADQRGEPRPGGSSGACDAGAYEFQGQNEDLIFGDRFEE